MQGVELEVGITVSGALVPSDRSTPPELLAARLANDGYVFLPGFFDAALIDAALAPMIDRLDAAGRLQPGFPAADLVARDGLDSSWLDGLTDGNSELFDLLYGRSTLEFFEGLLGGPIRPFDFTWSRAVGAGRGTAPHCDVVFMGRGTRRVVTMWTALCDIPEAVGGLAILEGSHREHSSLSTYRSFDVDTYCGNLGEIPTASFGAGGSLPCHDPNVLRSELEGRWLWAEYSPGDVLLFGLSMVHASLDNRSTQLRLSTDSRYQLASEPIDERWVGEHPPAHGLQSQRPTIC